MEKERVVITIALAVMSSVPTTVGQEPYPMLKSARSVLHPLWDPIYHLISAPMVYQILQCDWPNEYKAGMDALGENSTKNVVTGQTKALAIWQPNKCKATGEDVGHVATSFAPPVTPTLSSPPVAESSSSTSVPVVQTKLSQSWGESKLMAVCQ